MATGIHRQVRRIVEWPANPDVLTLVTMRRHEESVIQMFVLPPGENVIAILPDGEGRQLGSASRRASQANGNSLESDWVEVDRFGEDGPETASSAGGEASANLEPRRPVVTDQPGGKTACEGCIVVTSAAAYRIRQRVAPEKLFLQLVARQVGILVSSRTCLHKLTSCIAPADGRRTFR